MQSESKGTCLKNAIKAIQIEIYMSFCHLNLIINAILSFFIFKSDNLELAAPWNDH